MKSSRASALARGLWGARRGRTRTSTRLERLAHAWLFAALRQARHFADAHVPPCRRHAGGAAARVGSVASHRGRAGKAHEARVCYRQIETLRDARVPFKLWTGAGGDSQGKATLKLSARQ